MEKYTSMLTIRDKAILMGLFLSKFDKKALSCFGFKGFKEAFNVLGYSVKTPPSSIKNYRDEFDPYFPNPRKGWHKRKLRDYCKKVKDSMAEDLLDRYCLFVVSNFKEIPVHQLFFDPLRSGSLFFQRQERRILQVSYSTNIINQ